MPTKHFILASASPQRRLLLEGIGLQFDVIPSDLDESLCTEQDPVQRAKTLARLKAEDIASKHADAFVLGADTLVVSADGILLEKPGDADDARRMLRMHSGNTSVVHSTLCLISPSFAEASEGRPGGERSEALDSSKVTFKALSDDDIEWWISTNEWKDRSGAFQIDGKGQLMIEKLEGDWTGVLGLPIFQLGRLLVESGYRSA